MEHSTVQDSSEWVRTEYVIDPLHGKIEIPNWLMKIRNRPEVRRMINIRQLGLKAYTGFPGAIHTRYIHCLGTMHLAEKLRTTLIEREDGSRPDLEQNLKNNAAALQAAAFFHDSGHGPFSHVLDFVTRKELKKDHTELAIKVVEKCEDVLQKESISKDYICNMIAAKYQSPTAPYKFLGQIIDGPLDVDKMDYLLRDSYHVGLKYGFDLGHLLDQIRVLGEGDNLNEYQIGLADTPEAVVIAENFLLIWRSMYELVYYSRPTRIAEKMLEKAVIVAIRDDKGFMQHVSNDERFLQLEEATLLDSLRAADGFPSETVEAILGRNYYEVLANLSVLQIGGPDASFMKTASQEPDNTSEELTQKINEEYPEYTFIADIIQSRTPRNIRMDEIGVDDEPIDLSDRSIIVKAMSEPNMRLYIYGNHEIMKSLNIESELIEHNARSLIGSW